MIKKQGVAGLIITPESHDEDHNAKLLMDMEKSGIPVVFVDRDAKYQDFDAVLLDNIKGSFDAVNALLDEGHERIAIIAGPEFYKSGKERLNGYKTALEKRGIPIEKELIMRGDFQRQSGYEKTKEILKMEKRPTAIFISNNYMTLGCIAALTENGIKTPEDIAIIGFDDVDIFKMLGMNISVVNRPTTQMGAEAATLLFQKIKTDGSQRVCKTTLLSATLELRGSEKYIQTTRKEL